MTPLPLLPSLYIQNKTQNTNTNMHNLTSNASCLMYMYASLARKLALRLAAWTPDLVKEDGTSKANYNVRNYNSQDIKF